MSLPRSGLLLLSAVLLWFTSVPTPPAAPAQKEKLPEGVRARLGSVSAARGDAVQQLDRRTSTP